MKPKKKKIPKTEYLYLGYLARLAPEDLQLLKELPYLKRLNFGASNLRDEHLEIIGDLQVLEDLDLTMTEITDAGIAELLRLPKLKELRLKDNPQLGDAIMEPLAKIKGLRRLHLGGTSVTIKGLRKLYGKNHFREIILSGNAEQYPIVQLEIVSRKMPQCDFILKGEGTFREGNFFPFQTL